MMMIDDVGWSELLVLSLTINHNKSFIFFVHSNNYLKKCILDHCRSLDTVMNLTTSEELISGSLFVDSPDKFRILCFFLFWDKFCSAPSLLKQIYSCRLDMDTAIDVNKFFEYNKSNCIKDISVTLGKCKILLCDIQDTNANLFH